MQPRDCAAPSRWRQVLALAIFVGCAATAVAGLAWWPHHSKEKVSHSETMTRRASGDDGAFFYRTVGHAPAAGTAADEPAAPAAPRTPGRQNVDAAAAVTPGSSSYTLEIDVAQSREAAEKLIDELHDTGIEAFYTPLARAGRVVYRVRRGIYASQRDADRAAVAMRQEHAVEAKVVKLQ